MSKSVATAAVRKWHLTVCYDLCLPIIPVMVTLRGGEGETGKFFGRRDQRPTAFLGVDLDGLLLGETTGGATETTCRLEIYPREGYGERDYLRVLAHEARHAWLFMNQIAPTEEDCDSYAERFLSRFAAPTRGPYHGLVDEAQYEEAEQRRQRMENERAARIAAERAQSMRGIFPIVMAALSFVCAAGLLVSSPDAADARLSYLLAPLFIMVGIVLLYYVIGTTRKPAYSWRWRRRRPRESVLAEKRLAYSTLLKQNPDNGKAGQWEVGACSVFARSAEEAVEKVAAAGLLQNEFTVPRYAGAKL